MKLRILKWKTTLTTYSAGEQHTPAVRGLLEKLRAENEKLRHNLEFERLRVRAYERLIEIVKEEYGIDVLKKDGAKQ